VDEASADPLDLDEVLRRLQRSGASSPATELPTAPAASLAETPGGVSDPGDRGPELRRVRAVPYPADGPDLDGPQSVTVRVHVDVTGMVDAVEILFPHPSEALNRAAREAARGYRFAPALTDGRPVAAWSRPFEIPFGRD
jgi:protein TonB